MQIVLSYFYLFNVDINRDSSPTDDKFMYK
jgi:hypothetical protein